MATREPVLGAAGVRLGRARSRRAGCSRTAGAPSPARGRESACIWAPPMARPSSGRAERVVEFCRLLAARWGRRPILLGAPERRRVGGGDRRAGARGEPGRPRPTRAAAGAAVASWTCWSAATPASLTWRPRSARRVVTLFGPTDPRLSAPRGRVAVLTHPVPCAPCFYRACPIEHPCLDGISPDRVYAEIVRARTRARGRRADERRSDRTCNGRTAAGPAPRGQPMVDGQRRSDHPPGGWAARVGATTCCSASRRATASRPRRRRRGCRSSRACTASRLAPVGLAGTRCGCGRWSRREGIDIMHAHHSHDHWLSLLDPRARAARWTRRARPHLPQRALGQALGAGAPRSIATPPPSSRCRARSRHAAARSACRPSA